MQRIGEIFCICNQIMAIYMSGDRAIEKISMMNDSIGNMSWEYS